MVQQFPHHVVEPPDFFNPFYLLVNDVSAKMRPIILRFYPTFYVFFLLPAFPFFYILTAFFTLPRHSFPRARLFFGSLHSQGRHTHHSHSYELSIASFSPAFSLFSALSLPPALFSGAPLRATAGLFSDRPPLIRRASFSALFFLRAQHVFPPAHFLSLALPPPRTFSLRTLPSFDFLFPLSFSIRLAFPLFCSSGHQKTLFIQTPRTFSLLFPPTFSLPLFSPFHVPFS